MIIKKLLSINLLSKILVASTVVGVSCALDYNPHEGPAHRQTFKGNWTETFKTPAGEISHAPDCVQWGFITAGVGITMSKGSNFNGYTLLGDLILKTNSTRFEFVQALQAARLLNITAPKAQTKQAAKFQKAQAAQAKKAAANTKKAQAAIKKTQAAAAKRVAAQAKKAAANTKKAQATARKAKVAAAKRAAAQLKKAAANTKKVHAANKKAQVAAKKRAAAYAKKARARKV